MKAFTPARIKADLIFIASLVAVFGFNIPTAISVAVVGSAGLIAALLNLGDLLAEKYDPKLITDLAGELAKLEKDAAGVVPLLLPVLNALPGKVGEEVRKAVEAVEHGPSAGKAGS
jgi:hypothetical protein